MQSKATTVKDYLAELPPDRRTAIQAIRKVILDNMDRGLEEGMSYGMIGYYVPHSIYPAGYHCNPKLPLPYAALASQKQYMSLYLMSVYADPVEEKWLRDRWTKAGKKLDMGKCCIRFKKLDDVPLNVVAEAFGRVSVERHIAYYEKALGGSGARSRGTSAKAGGPARPKRTVAKGAKKKHAVRRASK
jgi:hypothetical protein